MFTLLCEMDMGLADAANSATVIELEQPTLFVVFWCFARSGSARGLKANSPGESCAEI